MATTVTIEKAYLDTLMRRAELHNHVPASSSPHSAVTISRKEYVSLLKQRDEYAALKQSLFSGGIDEETLDVLINNRSVAQDATLEETGHKARDLSNQPSLSLAQSYVKANAMNQSSSRTKAPSDQYHKPMLKSNPSYNDEVYFGSPNENEDGIRYLTASGEGPVYALSPDAIAQPYLARQENRTIRLKNISEHAQLKDILQFVRGGQVLDISMRFTEKACNVSFVQGSDAEAFFAHYRRNDLYIAGKRVEVLWNERAFILPNHVASKIKNGATRNLVIRNALKSFYTPDRIREDLEHIHQLVVVDVEHELGDLYISLNSVHNALYARTCMMSRTMYKGKKIEFQPDECANPLPEIHYKPRRESTAPKKLNPLANRFEMLNIEGTEDGSSTISDTEGGVSAGSLATDTISPRTIKV